MELFLFILRSTVQVGIFALLIAMMIRAVMSWLPIGDGGAFLNFIYAVTEPFIIPVRAVLERFEFVRNFPIDISFYVTTLILAILWEMI